MNSASTQRSTASFVLVVAVLAVGAAVYVAYLSGVPTSADIVAALFFAAAGALAHALAYRLPRGGFGDISFIPLLSAVAVVPGFPTVAGTTLGILTAELIR